MVSCPFSGNMFFVQRPKKTRGSGTRASDGLQDSGHPLQHASTGAQAESSFTRRLRELMSTVRSTTPILAERGAGGSKKTLHWLGLRGKREGTLPLLRNHKIVTRSSSQGGTRAKGWRHPGETRPGLSSRTPLMIPKDFEICGKAKRRPLELQN